MAVVKIDKKYRHLDIFYHPREIYPFAILHSTGSKEFNVEFRDLFLEKGFSLSEKGIKRGTARGPDITPKDIEARIRKKTIDTEYDIFDFIGAKYVKPEDRKSGIKF